MVKLMEEIKNKGICSHRDLIAFQKSYSLAREILKATSDFPPDERFELASQMRRAAVSIPTNISEGYQRLTRRQYIHFLSIAHGSCSELETLTDLSYDMDFIQREDYVRIQALQKDVSRLLWRLMEALRKPRDGA